MERKELIKILKEGSVDDWKITSPDRNTHYFRLKNGKLARVDSRWIHAWDNGVPIDPIRGPITTLSVMSLCDHLFHD